MFRMILDSRRWSAMFLYPCGKMLDCFTNVSVICITQTFKVIDYIGQQRQGSTALQWKRIFHFERCENNSHVNTILFLEQFLEFLTKYNGRQSNKGYEENCLNPVLFDCRILNTFITYVIQKSSLSWSEHVLRISILWSVHASQGFTAVQSYLRLMQVELLGGSAYHPTLQTQMSTVSWHTVLAMAAEQSSSFAHASYSTPEKHRVI